MSDGNPNDSTVTITAPPAPTVAPTVQTEPNSLFASQLANIKAEDGRQKFATVEKALESLPYNQAHIKELSDRNKELEAQVAQQQGMDAVLEQLRSQQAPVEQPAVGIDEARIDAMLDQRLTQRDTAATQSANATQVLDQLKATYGDKAETQFNERAASLGMSVDQLSSLARTSPQAALAFFDAPPAQVSNPTTGSINTTLEPQVPAKDESHMDIFNGGTSGTVASWRKAAAE